MQLLGAEVVPVVERQRTIQGAINEAIREWVTKCRHPRNTSSARSADRTRTDGGRDCPIASSGARALGKLQKRSSGLPDVPCGLRRWNGSNAIGSSTPDEAQRNCIVAGGWGRGKRTRVPCRAFFRRLRRRAHGTRSRILQAEFGQSRRTHLRSRAGLDYP